MNGVLGKVLMIVLSHDTIGDRLHAFAKEELCLLFSVFILFYFLFKFVFLGGPFFVRTIPKY